MTYTMMPETSSMQFFEDHVNSRCRAPARKGEVFHFHLPQRVSPHMISGHQRKKQNRIFDIVVVFVADEWQAEDGTRLLKWRYEDTQVLEIV